MPIQKIEEVSIAELALAIERIEKAQKELRWLVDICQTRKMETVWIYRVTSLRQSVAKLASFGAAVDSAASEIVRGKPLGQDSTKTRRTAGEKAEAAQIKLSEARRAAPRRPD